jgi:hypothetical protein
MARCLTPHDPFPRIHTACVFPRASPDSAVAPTVPPAVRPCGARRMRDSGVQYTSTARPRVRPEGGVASGSSASSARRGRAPRAPIPAVEVSMPPLLSRRPPTARTVCFGVEGRTRLCGEGPSPRCAAPTASTLRRRDVPAVHRVARVARCPIACAPGLLTSTNGRHGTLNPRICRRVLSCLCASLYELALLRAATSCYDLLPLVYRFIFGRNLTQVKSLGCVDVLGLVSCGETFLSSHLDLAHLQCCELLSCPGSAREVRRPHKKSPAFACATYTYWNVATMLLLLWTNTWLQCFRLFIFLSPALALHPPGVGCVQKVAKSRSVALYPFSQSYRARGNSPAKFHSIHS